MTDSINENSTHNPVGFSIFFPKTSVINDVTDSLFGVLARDTGSGAGHVLPITETYYISNVFTNRNSVNRNKYNGSPFKRTNVISEKQVATQKIETLHHRKKSQERLDLEKTAHLLQSHCCRVKANRKKTKNSSHQDVHLQEAPQNAQIFRKHSKQRNTLKEQENKKIKVPKCSTTDHGQSMKLPNLSSNIQQPRLFVYSPKTLFESNKKETENVDTKMKNMVSISPRESEAKIYYSENQTLDLNSIPSVPSCTPAVTSASEECVLSLADIKSQREVKNKLLKLERKQLCHGKKKIKKAQEFEKERLAIEKENLIKIQRQIIYELNKIMSEYESEQFEMFKQQHNAAPV